VTTMLAYLDRNGPPAASAVPVLLCDQCLTPIQGDVPNSGIVIWRNHPDGTQELAHVHKGPCARAIQAARPTPEWNWEELDVWLAHLVHNTKAPFENEPNVEFVAPRPSQWRQGKYERPTPPQ